MRAVDHEGDRGGGKTCWVPLGGYRDAAPVVSRANRGCRGHAASQNGATALVRAASGGHTETVELLLDRGADLEVKGRVRAAAV